MTTLPESPYSLNTHFVDRRGFCVQVTLRGEDGGDTMKRFDALLDWLMERGGLPADRYGNPVGRPVPQEQVAAVNGNGHAQGGNGNGQPPQDASYCPIHGVTMKLYQKDGRSWYSHRTDDGGWCSGKARKK